MVRVTSNYSRFLKGQITICNLATRLMSCRIGIIGKLILSRINRITVESDLLARVIESDFHALEKRKKGGE